MGTVAGYKVLYVIWTDASYQGSTVSVDELTPLVTLHSVGWLVREDETSLSLAMECDPEDHTVRHVTHIPKVNIVSRKVLRVRHERAKPKTS